MLCSPAIRWLSLQKRFWVEVCPGILTAAYESSRPLTRLRSSRVRQLARCCRKSVETRIAPCGSDYLARDGFTSYAQTLVESSFCSLPSTNASVSRDDEAEL